MDEQDKNVSMLLVGSGLLEETCLQADVVIAHDVCHRTGGNIILPGAPCAAARTQSARLHHAL